MIEFLQSAKLMCISVFEAIMPGVPLASGQTPLWPVAVTFCVSAVAIIIMGHAGALLEWVFERYCEKLVRERLDVASSHGQGAHSEFVSGIGSFDGRRALLGGSYVLWSLSYIVVVFYCWVSFVLMAAWAPVAVAAALG